MADVVRDDAFWRDQGEIVKRPMRRILRRAYMAGARAAADEPRARRALKKSAVRATNEPPPEGFNLIEWNELRRAAEAYIDDYVDSWWAELEATTRDALRDAIRDVQENGGSLADVRRRIRPWFDQTRADTIAITETSRLMGQGAQATYRALGFPGWEWRTAADDHVCVTCNDRARASRITPYPMGVAFIPAHPRCRCWPVPKGTPAVPHVANIQRPRAA